MTRLSAFLLAAACAAACAHHEPRPAPEARLVASIALDAAAEVATAIQPANAPECLALRSLAAGATSTAVALRSEAPILPALDLEAGACLDLPGLPEVGPPPPVVAMVVRQLRGAADLAIALAGDRLTCPEREALAATAAFVAELAAAVTDEFTLPDGRISVAEVAIVRCGDQ